MPEPQETHWWQGLVECSICDHHWQAVIEIDIKHDEPVVAMECPNCGNLCGQPATFNH